VYKGQIMAENAQQELAQVIGFEVDEVKTNAAGKLSKRQRSRLRVMSGFMFMAAVVFANFIWSAITIANHPQCYERCDTIQFLRGWMALSFSLFCLFIGLRFVLWLPKVQSATGKIRIYSGIRSLTTPFKVVVGKIRLSIGWATWSILLPKSEYAGEVQMYYLEVLPYIIKPILSVEPVEE
jgi:hypothetical protein